jgi:hypothetical protein
MQFALSTFALTTSIVLSVAVSGQTLPPIPDHGGLVARGLVSGGSSASNALVGACTPDWVSTFGPAGNPNVQHPITVAATFGSGAARRWITVRNRVNATGIVVPFVDAWDGSGWTTFGEVTGEVSMLQVLDDGSGERLYAGGSFSAIGGVAASGIAVHDGVTWNALGGGVSGRAQCAELFDTGQGPVLIVGGEFTTAGGVQARNIASWDGATWSALVGGAIEGSRVGALAVDASGPAPVLYVGGTFTRAGGIVCNSVARWNGNTWSNMGPGLNNVFVFQSEVYDLALFDEGQGPRLFAIGRFDGSGPTNFGNIARWDGTSWSSLGGAQAFGAGGRHLLVHDDGTGLELYLGGQVTTAGGQELARGVARWDGATWEGLPGAPFDGVVSLSVFDPGDGRALMCAGSFLNSPTGDAFVTRWRGCPPLVGTEYCAPAVPNSTGIPGQISASGSLVVANNALALTARDLPNNSFGYFLTSRTQTNIPQPGGSLGVLCVGGLIGRYVGPGQIQSTGATGAIFLLLNLDRIPTPAGPVAAVAGQTWNFQAWHRDAVGGVVVSNFTSAVSVTMQ